MPNGDKYLDKIFGALEGAYGVNGSAEKGAFTLSKDEFVNKIESDTAYATKIFGALDGAYGVNGSAEKGAFTLSKDDFFKAIYKEQAPKIINTEKKIEAVTVVPTKQKKYNVSFFKVKTQAEDKPWYTDLWEVVEAPEKKLNSDDIEYLIGEAGKKAKAQKSFEKSFYSPSGKVNEQYASAFVDNFISNVGYKDNGKALNSSDVDNVKKRFNNWLTNQKAATPLDAINIQKKIAGMTSNVQYNMYVSQAASPEEKKAREAAGMPKVKKPSEPYEKKSVISKEGNYKDWFDEDIYSALSPSDIEQIDRYLLNNPGERSRYQVAMRSKDSQVELISNALGDKLENAINGLQVYKDKGVIASIEQLNKISGQISLQNAQLEILKKQIDAYSPPQMSPEQKRAFQSDKAAFQIKDSEYRESLKDYQDVEASVLPIMEQLNKLLPLAESGDQAAAISYNSILNENKLLIDKFNESNKEINRILEERNAAAKTLDKYASSSQDILSFNQYKESVDKYNSLIKTIAPLFEQRDAILGTVSEQDIDQAIKYIEDISQVSSLREKLDEATLDKMAGYRQVFANPVATSVLDSDIFKSTVGAFSKSLSGFVLKGVSGTMKLTSDVLEIITKKPEDYYSGADYAADMITKGFDLSGDIWTNEVIPGYQMKDFVDPTTGKFVYSPLSIVSGSAEQFGIVAGAAIGTSIGMGSGMSFSASVMAPMFFATYEDNKSLARDLGYEGKFDNMLAGSLFSLIEGASELIMPDIQLFKAGAKYDVFKRFLDNFQSGGKTVAIKGIFSDIAKEYGEELTVELGKVLTTYLTSAAGGDNEQYKVTGSDLLQTFIFTSIASGAPSALKNVTQSTSTFNNAVLFEMAKDQESSISIVDTYNNLGKIDSAKAEQLKIQIAAVAAIQGKLPRDMSEPKKIAISGIYAKRAEIQKKIDDPNIANELKDGYKASISLMNKQIADIVSQDDAEFIDMYNAEMKEQSSVVMDSIKKSFPSVAKMQEAAVQEGLPEQIFGDGAMLDQADNIEARMNAAEEIHMQEINSALSGLYTQIETIFQNYSDNPVAMEYAQALFDKIDQLKSYEFATNKETKVVAETATIQTARNAVEQEFSTIQIAGRKEKPGKPARRATVTLEDGTTAQYTIRIDDQGNVTLNPDSGAPISLGDSRSVNESMAFVDTKMAQNGMPSSITFTMQGVGAERGRKQVTITTANGYTQEELLDIAINLRAKEIGTVDPTAFDEAFMVVSQKEVETTTFPNLGKKDAIQEQAAGQVPVQPEARPGETVAERAARTGPEKTAQAGQAQVQAQKGAPKVTSQASFEIQNAVRSIARALQASGIKVFVIETQEEMDRISGRRDTDGLFIGTKGEIYFSLPKITGTFGKTIIFHESTHPVINIIRNTNPELYKKVADGLKQAMKSNAALRAAAQSIIASPNYATQEQRAANPDIFDKIKNGLPLNSSEIARMMEPGSAIEDEIIVETIAGIASGDINPSRLSPSLIDSIKEMINKIAAIFNIPPIAKVSDRTSFINTAKAISDALKTGKSIAGIVGEENVSKFKNTISDGQYSIDIRIADKGVQVPRSEKLPLKIVPSKEESVMRRINELLDKYPKALTDKDQWKELMSRVFPINVDGEVFIPAFPEGLARMAKNVQETLKEINKVSDEQRKLASEGLKGTKEIGELYKQGKMDEVDTGLYFLWNIMSIGISPYPQESGFLQAVNGGIDKYIKLAADGKFTKETLEEYLNWVDKVLPKGTPGAGSKSNLNSFGKSFLSKAAEKIESGEFEGKTKLQALHEIISDRKTPTNELRRKWQANMSSMQFNNKIFDFILLTTGRSDLFVTDRVRVDHFWDGNNFKKKRGLKESTSLYDGSDLTYGASTGAGFSKILSDVPGLVFNELANRTMTPVVKKAYKQIGVKEYPEVGRFHWETWVAASSQEVSHGSIDAIVQRKEKGEIQDAGIRQGKYGAWDFNFSYKKRAGKDFVYEFVDNDGNTYVFDKIIDIQDEIENQKKKTYETNNRFLLPDEKGNISRPTKGLSSAWYDTELVDSEKYFKFLRSKAKEIIPAPNVFEDQGVIIETSVDQDKQASAGISRTTSTTAVKPGVLELFESNPELASIGTPEQYSAYLDTVFPDSNVKDIVYHRTKNNKFDKFNNKTENYVKNDTYTKDGIYFNNNVNNGKEIYGENVIEAIVNITNPYLFKSENLFAKEGDNPYKLSLNSIKQEQLLGKEDGILFKPNQQNGQTIVFEPEQIHILGSQKDIEGFKKFVAAPTAPAFQEKTGAQASAGISRGDRTEPVNIPGSPAGTYINVGLLEGMTEARIPISDITSKLPVGVDVIDAKEVTGTEPTVSIQISRKLSDSEMDQLLLDTKQMAIPQLSEGEGVLHGTTDWGPFNPDFFIMPENRSLADITGVRGTQPSAGIKRGNLVAGTYYEPNLTTDTKGNYIFFHVTGASKKDIMKGIDSRKFQSLRTSREEKGLQYGIASFYTKPEDGERMVGGTKYYVTIAPNKVYPMDTDPKGYRAAAEKKIKEGTPFREEKVKKAIAESAAKDGFEMAIGEWAYDRTGRTTPEVPALRGDALTKLIPKEYLRTEKFKTGAQRGITTPYPGQKYYAAKQDLFDIASDIESARNRKNKYDEVYDIANKLKSFGGVIENYGEPNEFIRDINQDEFDTLYSGATPKQKASLDSIEDVYMSGPGAQASAGIVRGDVVMLGGNEVSIDALKLMYNSPIGSRNGAKYGDVLEYNGNNKQIIDVVNYINNQANPYVTEEDQFVGGQIGKLKGGYIESELMKAFDSMPFNKFMVLYRKHIDPSLKRESRRIPKGVKWEEVALEAVTETKMTSKDSDAFIAFAKDAGITIPPFTKGPSPLFQRSAGIVRGALSSVEATTKALDGVFGSNNFIRSAAKSFPNRGITGGVIIADTNGTELAEVELGIKNDSAIELENIVSRAAGKGEGFGTKALSILKNMADIHGVKMFLYPEPIKLMQLTGLNKDALIKFYEKNGFKYFKALGQSVYSPKDSQSTSEAYHKAKADGSNPELVKAVEDILTTPGYQASAGITRGAINQITSAASGATALARRLRNGMSDIGLARFAPGVENKALRDMISQDDRRFYTPISWSKIKDKIDTMSEAELIDAMDVSDPQTIWDNIVSLGGPAAPLALQKYMQIQFAKRQSFIAAGNTVEAERIDQDIKEKYISLKEFGTILGQALGMYRVLKSMSSNTDFHVDAIEAFIDSTGGIITKDQRAMLRENVDAVLAARLQYESELQRINKLPAPTESDMAVLNMAKSISMNASTKLNLYIATLMQDEWALIYGTAVKGGLLSYGSALLSLTANMLVLPNRMAESALNNMTVSINSMIRRLKGGNPVSSGVKAVTSINARGLIKALENLLQEIKKFASNPFKYVSEKITETRNAIANYKAGINNTGALANAADIVLYGSQEHNDRMFGIHSKMNPATSMMRVLSSSKKPMLDIKGMATDIEQSYKKSDFKSWLRNNYYGMTYDEFMKLDQADKENIKDQFFADKKKDQPVSRSFFKDLAKATSGSVAELNFRMLALTDYVPKSIMESHLLERVGNNLGLDGVDLELFKHDPYAYVNNHADLLSPEVLNYVFENAAELTMAKETGAGRLSVATVNLIKNLPNLIRTKGFGKKDQNAVVDSISGAISAAVDTTMPYVQLPMNATSYILDFAFPLKSAAKSYWFFSLANEAKKKGKGGLADSYSISGYKYMSRSIIGSAYVVLATTIATVPGLVRIGGGKDEDEEERRMNKTLGTNVLNVSAFRRYINNLAGISNETTEYRDGDTEIDLKNLGVLGMMIYAYGSSYKAARSKFMESKYSNEMLNMDISKNKKLKDYAWAGKEDLDIIDSFNMALTSVKYMLDQAWFLSIANIADVVNAKDDDGYAVNKLMSTYIATAASAIPLFSAYAKKASDVVREMKGEPGIDTNMSQLDDFKLDFTESLLYNSLSNRNYLMDKIFDVDALDDKYVSFGMFGKPTSPVRGEQQELPAVIWSLTSPTKDVVANWTETERFFNQTYRQRDMIDLRGKYSLSLMEPKLNKKETIIVPGEAYNEAGVTGTFRVPAKDYNELTMMAGKVNERIINRLADRWMNSYVNGVKIVPEDLENPRTANRKEVSDVRKGMAVAISESHKIVNAFLKPWEFLKQDTGDNVKFLGLSTSEKIAKIQAMVDSYVLEFKEYDPATNQAVDSFVPLIDSEIQRELKDLADKSIEMYVRELEKSIKTEKTINELNKREEVEAEDLMRSINRK